jgi:putative phosphoribosyl transferase
MFEPPASSVEIAVSPTATLVGDLLLPASPIGWVVFAHASGNSRLTPRHRQIARRLHRSRIATLLTDLLTLREDEDEARRVDVPLLAARLRLVTQWLRLQEMAAGLPLGYFGAGAGAAAAMAAAAEGAGPIAAVVSRGGRLDLAGAPILARVQAPTLLLVGGHDAEVLDLNRQAYAQLSRIKHLHVVQGATHLFEEAGAMDEVAHEASNWFVRHFSPPAAGNGRRPGA